MTVPDYVPLDLVVDFDVYDHSRAGELHETLATMREKTPVAYTETSGGHWILTRYEDIQRVLRDPATFSSFPTAIPRHIHEQTRMIPIAYDAPQHTTYRNMITPLFSPQRVRDLESDIRQLVTKLLDDMVAKGGCEFVSEFARPLPSTVFLLLMGWPLDDAAQFHNWTNDILTASEDDVRNAAIGEVFGYFGALIYNRRANPCDDFTTVLINEKYEGRDLTDEELLNMLLLLMLGGLHTVQGALSYSVIYLAEHPEVRAELIADESLLPHAIEEMLRWEAPAWPSRRTLQDVEIAGVKIPADEMILLALTSANHDEDEFPTAHRMVLDRQPNRHLTFSAGPHRCLGSHLARLEMRVAIEELHRRIPNYRLDPANPPIRHMSTVNGVIALPLTFE